MSMIPEVKALRAPKLPAVAERTLDNGLRVLAVRKPGVPLFETRMVTPVARAKDSGDGARQRMLSEAILSGTETRSDQDIANELQRAGGSLYCSLDADELGVFGSALASALPSYLELLGDIVTGATYPNGEVALHRARVQQEIAIVSGQPGVIAEGAYRKRLYGGHPYAQYLPAPESVEKVTPAVLRKLHQERVQPRGSTLIIVGDVKPDRALDAVEKALGGWVDGGNAGQLPAPGVPEPGPITLVDRPGSVQTTIRVGGPAIPRNDPDYAALSVANTIFGGYFSSRLVANIREDKGYTYSPSSGISQHLAASHLTIGADVATDVTAAALMEIRYELARMGATLVKPDELSSAKRYLQGTMAIATQTQGGLASYLAALASWGLGVEYLRDQPARIEEVTAEQVRDVAARYLAPRRLVTVAVGDAEKVRPALEVLDEVVAG